MIATTAIAGMMKPPRSIAVSSLTSAPLRAATDSAAADWARTGVAGHGDREHRSHRCLLETHLELPVELFGVGSATVVQC